MELNMMNMKRKIAVTVTLAVPRAAALMVFFGALLSLSCSSRPKPQLAAARAVPALATAATVSPASPTSTAWPDDRLPLPERLAREAASRPSSGPPVEAVAAALSRSGIQMGPLHQVLGRTIGARFCMAGHTRPGLVVSICEFADEPQAVRGMAWSRQTFDRLIPNRRLERNRSTVLTLTRPALAPGLDDETDRVTRLFASI
jgi:hypothetical protein